MFVVFSFVFGGVFHSSLDQGIMFTSLHRSHVTHTIPTCTKIDRAYKADKESSGSVSLSSDYKCT